MSWCFCLCLLLFRNTRGAVGSAWTFAEEKKSLPGAAAPVEERAAPRKGWSAPITLVILGVDGYPKNIQKRRGRVFSVGNITELEERYRKRPTVGLGTRKYS